MAERLVYLNFHGIGQPPQPIDDEEVSVWLDQDRFEQVLDEAANHPQIRLTFDDGNASDLALALPALVERDLKATFFIVGSRIDQPNYLSTNDLQRMVEAGMSIGSHGMAHRSWRGLDSQAQHAELHQAKDRIEQAIGQSLTQAACPFGQYDRQSLAGLDEAGFTRVYTSDRGRARPDQWLVPRNTLNSQDGPETVRRIMDEGRFMDQARRFKRWVKQWR